MFSEKDLEKILQNPFYCMTVDKMFTQEHPYIVTKSQWIEANVKLINEIGAEKWLRNLIAVLEGRVV
jgi:hypothetical protein